jgi:hypothetical protein
LRLDPYLRAAIYGVLAALFMTGAAWLAADALKDGPGGEAWQAVAANLLTIHGGAAMVSLMLIGALFPLHVGRGWRSNKNRASGSVMLAMSALLIVTAFGLYYSGAEVLRAWTSYVHIGVGLVLPVAVLIHVLLGRRITRVAQSSSALRRSRLSP